MNSIIQKAAQLKQNKLLKNYIWVLLGQNAGSIFSMLTLVFTLRTISTYDYGTLTIIQTYCLLISNLICLHTFNGVIKYVTEAEKTEDYHAAKKYINTAFAADALTGILGVVCGLLLLNTVTELMGWDANGIRFAHLYIPAIAFYPILNGAPIGVLRKFGYFKQVNVLHTATYGLQFLVMLLIYTLGIRSFSCVLLVYALTEIVESVILFVYAIIVLQKQEQYRNFWKAGLSLEKAYIQYNISNGLLLAFDQALGNLSTLLINRYIGNLGTAYLKVITRICSVFTKLAKPISQVFYPEICEWITNKEYKKALRVSMKYFVIVLGIGAGVLAAMFFTYDWWIVLFDAGMTSAKMQSMLYLLYSILSVAAICLHQQSFAMNMMRFNLCLVGFMDLLYIVMLIPLVRMWGVEAYLLLQIGQLLAVFFGKWLYIRYRIHRVTVEEKGE